MTMHSGDHRYSTVVWLEGEDMQHLPTSQYWNDKDIERSKVFDISDGDFTKLDAKLCSKGILPQVDELLRCKGGGLHGKGISLGAGICWLESWVLRGQPAIEQMICLEFSRHRIFDLAPLQLAREGVAADRVVLCLGSFYDLRVPDRSLDFVILCQAFHHASDPHRLLAEIRRALKPDGVVLIVGEHYFGWAKRLRQVAAHGIKWLINHKGYRNSAPLVPTFKDLFPGDPVKGDIHYTHAEYAALFEEFGFMWMHVCDSASAQQGFCLQFEHR